MNTNTITNGIFEMMNVTNEGINSIERVSYEATKLVTYFHESTPRFGHSENVALLASDISTEQKDYILGTIFVSLFFIMILSLWCVGLVIMKAMNHLGLICVIAEESDEKTIENHKMTPRNSSTRSQISSFEEHEQNEYYDAHKLESDQQKLFYSRIIFMLFAIFSVIPTSFLARGLSRLEESYESLQYSNAELHLNMQSGFELTDELMMLSESVISRRDKVVELYKASISEADEICLENSSSILFSLAGQTMSKSLTNLGENFINPSFLTLNFEIQKAEEYTSSTGNELDSLSWWFGYSICLVIIVNILCIALIVGLLFEWQGNSCGLYQKCQSQILIPLFMAIVLLIGVTSAIFAMVLVVNSDFCYGSPDDGLPGSPDQVILDMLDSQVGKDTLLYRSFNNYIEGCDVYDPSDFVVEFDIKMNQAMIHTKNFLDVLPEDITTLHSTCGEKAGFVAVEAKTLLTSFEELSKKLFLATNVLKCEQLGPVYHQTIHNDVCTDAPKGLFGVFLGSALLAVNCMIMLTALVFKETLDLSNYVKKPLNLTPEELYLHEEAQKKQPPQLSTEQLSKDLYNHNNYDVNQNTSFEKKAEDDLYYMDEEILQVIYNDNKYKTHDFSHYGTNYTKSGFVDRSPIEDRQISDYDCRASRFQTTVREQNESPLESSLCTDRETLETHIASKEKREIYECSVLDGSQNRRTYSEYSTSRNPRTSTSQYRGKHRVLPEFSHLI